jgi:peptidoglycan/xylan/chitin deacetylase (PgdA/CDA1 family)
MRFIITAIILFAVTSSARADLYVLCYHSFLGKTNVPYDFTIEELKAHLDYFKQKGFRFVSYRDLMSGNISGKKNILVSIDDGNHSVFKAYHEVFKPMGIKPLLAIYPNIIGKKEYVMNWAQLKSLVDDGCDIAAHGYFHLKLNKKLYEQNRRDFLQEITKSKKMLEEKLGITITSFAYPFGIAIEETVKTLRDAGYKTGFTIVGKAMHLPLERNNAYMLPRFMLTRPLAKSHIAHIARLAGSPEAMTKMNAVNGKVMPVSSHESSKAEKALQAKASKDMAFGKDLKTTRKEEKKSNQVRSKSEKQKTTGVTGKTKPARKDSPDNPSKKAKELDIPDLVMHRDEHIDVAYRMSGIGILAVSHDEKKPDTSQKNAVTTGSGGVRPPAIIRKHYDFLAKETVSIYYAVLRLYYQKMDGLFEKLNRISKAMAQKVKSARG